MESHSQNLYADAPKFFVPNLPSIPKFPEPSKEVIRFQTGCDMRTLRKQLDIINAELDDCLKSQRELYEKNLELWHYMKSLVESNESNAQIMQKEMFRIENSLEEIRNKRIILDKKVNQTSNIQNVRYWKHSKYWVQFYLICVITMFIRLIVELLMT